MSEHTKDTQPSTTTWPPELAEALRIVLERVGCERGCHVSCYRCELCNIVKPARDSLIAGITSQAAEIVRLRRVLEWIAVDGGAHRRGQIVALEWVLMMDEKARGGLGNKGSWRKMAAAGLSRLRSEAAQ